MDRIILIKRRTEILSKEVDAVQRKLLSFIFDALLDQLETSNGVILFNNKNISISSAIDKIYDEFNSKVHFGVVSKFASDLVNISTLSASYFKTFETGKSIFEKTEKKAMDLLRANLGLGKDNSVSKGKFLEKFVSDEVLRQEIKDSTFKAISSGKSFKVFKEDLGVLIKGDENYAGGLQRHYRTYAYDTYSMVDAATSNVFGNELGLTAFVFDGNIIKTTRPFCRDRAGKVFLVSEAKEWANLEFQGKPKDYDPLNDRGGYNCRHTISYISNLEAMRRRDDLKENKEGGLVIG